MKISYIANIRLPTERAHGIQIMKMCEAFAANGHDVELFIPWRFNPIKNDPFEYYGVEKNFKIAKVTSFDLIWLGKSGFWLQSLFFSFFLSFCFIFKKTDIVYCRDEIPLFFLSFFKKEIFWETHSAKINFMAKIILQKCRGVIAINGLLRGFYIKLGASSDKIITAHDGVDLEKFFTEKSAIECRRNLGLPENKKIVMYTGHLYKRKGVNTLAEAAKFFEEDVAVVFVGGMAKDVKEFSYYFKENRNILILGKKPYWTIPLYLKSADVLVLPNSASEESSSLYTSPMKLFEYMASGNPIVVSDLPAIREVLNSDEAYFAQPDNSLSFAENIKAVLENYSSAREKAKKALYKVKDYQWKNRAIKILNFIKERK